MVGSLRGDVCLLSREACPNFLELRALQIPVKRLDYCAGGESSSSSSELGIPGWDGGAALWVSNLWVLPLPSVPTHHLGLHSQVRDKELSAALSSRHFLQKSSGKFVWWPRPVPWPCLHKWDRTEPPWDFSSWRERHSSCPENDKTLSALLA